MALIRGRSKYPKNPGVALIRVDLARAPMLEPAARQDVLDRAATLVRQTKHLIKCDG